MKLQEMFRFRPVAPPAVQPPVPRQAGAPDAGTPDAALDPGLPTAREKGPLLSLEMEAQATGEPRERASTASGADRLAGAPADPLAYASGVLPTRFSPGPVEQPARASETGAASAAGFLLIVDLLEGMLDATRRQFRDWRSKTHSRAKTNARKASHAADAAAGDDGAGPAPPGTPRP